MISCNLLPIKNIASVTLIDKRLCIIVKGETKYKILFSDNIKDVKN